MEDKNPDIPEFSPDLTPQKDNTVVASPSNKSNKKFVFIGVAVMLLFFIAVGSFMLGMNYQSKPKVAANPENLVKISARPTAAASVMVSNFNLQDFLSESCKKIGTNDSYFYGFKSDSLPFTYNEDLITPNLQNGNYFTCGFYEPGKRNGYIPLGKNTNIYDKNSEELGHGGPSYIGEYGKKIEDKNNIKFFISLGGLPEGGDALLENLTVDVRGIKTFKTQDGEYYALVTSVVIPANDPRLLNILNKYSEDSQMEPGKKALKTSENVESDIVKQLFNNPSNLSNPEKEAVANIIESLDSIKLKGE